MELQGIERDYGKDPAKRRIRALFRTFIEGTFPQNRQFGWMNVLSLVGGECHEFNEVYAQLPGLRPSCLAVVERDRLSARLIKASLPEAEVFAGELSDYVQKTKRKFDVVSLDFTTPMGPWIMSVLGTLRRRELLSDRAAIMVAVSGKRENKTAKTTMHDLAELAMLHDTPGQSVETTLRDDHLPAEVVEENLNGVRNDALTHGISCNLLGGPERVYPDWVDRVGNAALKQRIVEESFRTYVAARSKQGSAHMFDGEEFEDVHRQRGKTVKRMGLKMGVGGYTTNPDFETFLEATKDADIVPIDKTSENDTPANPDHPFAYSVAHIKGEKSLLFVNKEKWKLWQAAFWKAIENYQQRDEFFTKPEFVCWSLYKDALLKLFNKDLAGDEKGYYQVRPGMSFEVKKWMPGLLFEYTFGGPAGVYWVTRNDRYRYVSDTGCPMLVDFFRVDRQFRYDKLVKVSPEGMIVPNVPDEIMNFKVEHKRDVRKLRDFMDSFFDDFVTFTGRIAEAMHVNAGEMYPDRVEITGEEAMGDCAECDRKEKELDLLKAQLREMKEVVRDSKGSKKLVRKVFKVGDYERRKIVEMLVLRRTDEEIMKELNVGKMQIAGIKALATRLGGFDKTLSYFDERQKGTA